jgi:hypothetical protein
LVAALWSIVEDEFVSVDDWLAVTPLDTLWSPLPTFTPGLIFAPALISVLLTPTFASTPTFGFTLTELPLTEPLHHGVPLEEDCALDVPWFIVELEPWSLDDWLAATLLETDWSPDPEALPVLTPGLTFAAALTSLFAMPTFAPTPTFGLTLAPLAPEPADRSVEDDCADEALWSIVDDEFTSVDDWFAEVPTLASTPTFGLALI